jgi:hypothetical protein
MIKTVHTVVWAFFAGCVVLVEVAILGFNGGQCPLTRVAGRYTDERRPNFDIFLPAWLARYNKVIFGVVYLVGISLTVARWRSWIP